jgi:cell division protein FtsA
VPDAFKQLGVAMADIGGGTTDGLVFKGGRPVFAFTVNVAGKHMTNDLAIGLSLSHEVAETVKLRFGVKPRPGDQMTVTDIRGIEKLVGEADTNPVLLPRLQELSALLARELYPYRGALGAGLLLTGGGADVIGITEYFQSRLHIPVARARPMLSDEDGSGSAEAAMARSPHPTKFATVIGLLNLEIGRLGDLERTRKVSWTNRYIGQFFNWIRELS